MAAVIDNPILDRFAGRLRLSRVALGMSTEDLAKKVGCSRQHISKIESGSVNLTLLKASNLAEAVGRELNELLGGRFVLDENGGMK